MKGATGQAASEYLVVLAFCVIVLVAAAAEPPPIQELIQAIKEYFSAYSYAISVSP